MISEAAREGGFRTSLRSASLLHSAAFLHSASFLLFFRPATHVEKRDSLARLAYRAAICGRLLSDSTYSSRCGCARRASARIEAAQARVGRRIAGL
jgi:hypothetical protein